jgi:hypothetical protein
VADVQLADAGQPGNRLDVVVIQRMTGVETHAQSAHSQPGLTNLGEFGEHRRCFGIAALFVKGVGVGAGVDLADAGADPRSRLDLRPVRRR